MGLAASQARFLCLTARKANCEYKSTVLAQEKLDITDQMSIVAYDYAQAMNATKLMWCPNGMSGDFGLTYSLLMMPSAANDFDPYMVTTPSGAIVLNTAYMEAAKAASISPAGGGSGSEDQRDKFLAALVKQGVITETSARDIMVTDYKAVVDDNNNYTFTTVAGASDSVAWQSKKLAGMGAEPMIKTTAGVMTLSGLIMNETMGGRIIDWAKMFVEPGETTSVEIEYERARLQDLRTTIGKGAIDKDVINQLKVDYSAAKEKYRAEHSDLEGDDYKTLCAGWDEVINYATLYNNVDPDHPDWLVNANKAPVTYKNEEGETVNVTKADVLARVKEKIDAAYAANEDKESKAVSFSKYINISQNSLDYDAAKNPKAYSVVVNGGINHYEDELKNMTLGDILTQQVVLMANDHITTDSSADKKEAFQEQVLKMLDSMAGILGYSTTRNMEGQGLNVDDASAKALQFAYYMVKNTFLKATDYQAVGSRYNNHAMTENSAYQNAVQYNRLASDGEGETKSNKYYAVSLSNMMAAFLTYYENALSGINSPYVVGKSVDTSKFVTQDSGYAYIANDETDAIPMNEKLADFYDKLYNNIVEHGWRYDGSVDDNEYLETVLKNGRYSMCSLNEDGYYYQTRYNETGYMVEVSDTDAIARAEAEFTAKKAELTYKEDTIDMKTKKLDAEIASISAEVDSVRNIISKAIEKTFTMFST